MWQYLLEVLWTVVLPVLLFTGVVALVVTLIAKIIYNPRPSGWQPVIFGFSLLGGLVGLFAGASQTPVLGTVLPALLTFLTAMFAYLFGKDSLTEWRPVLPFCIITVMIAALYGTFVGTSIRQSFEEGEKRYKEWLLHYEKVGLPVAKKGYIKILNGEKLDPKNFDPLLQSGGETLPSEN